MQNDKAFQCGMRNSECGIAGKLSENKQLYSSTFIKIINSGRTAKQAYRQTVSFSALKYADI